MRKRPGFHDHPGLFPVMELNPVKSLWTPPDHFPDLSQAKTIAFDVETCDPHLKDLGPGCPRKDGYICGLSVGTDDGWRGYFPMRHELGANLDPETVLRWAKTELGRPNQMKVGANLLYDLEWLSHEGVEVQGPLYDVQVAEPLLDENKFSYSLETLAQDYLGEGKVSNEMYEWLSSAYGGPATRKAQAGRIHRAHSAVVGPYAESDVDLPLRIMEHQLKRLHLDGLMDVFNLESSLLPMLIQMRKRGVRVDIPLAEKIDHALGLKIAEDNKRFVAVFGKNANPNIPETMAAFFDQEGVPYPRTKTGKPSITKEWMMVCPHPAGQLIREVRMWEKYRTTFVRGYILDAHVNGRIHGRFHPLKGDDNGTISGRYSSSMPNLENIPAGEKDSTTLTIDGEVRKLGKWIRAMFVPDEGEVWSSDDYSQVEYRILCHYGTGDSAEKAKEMYRKDPTTDFHEMTDLGRKRAKMINFGKAYGAGAPTLANNMGVSVPEAQEFIDQYDEKMPFVGELLKACSEVATNRGYVKTILGRRARFELWEERGSRRGELLPKDKATGKWGRKIQRARCYSALNRVIQGGAADIFKTALNKIQSAGIFNVLGCPVNLVHDEICWSIPPGKEAAQAHAEALDIMKAAVKLTVPLLVDSEMGPSWGEVK